jgi:hypothetical protein
VNVERWLTIFVIYTTERERCTNNWVLYLRKLLFFYKEFSEKESDFTAITVWRDAG